MNRNWRQLIDKYYPEGSPLRDIFLRHSNMVADFALKINSHFVDPLDQGDVTGAAMMHDIGIFLTNAPSIECNGKEPYIRHGVLGAALLRSEGFPESWALVCERHTGAGLTESEIESGCLPLDKDCVYVPESTLEKLVCYADKFYSKSGNMKMKKRDDIITLMGQFGEASKQRFLSIENDLIRRTNGDSSHFFLLNKIE